MTMFVRTDWVDRGDRRRLLGAVSMAIALHAGAVAGMLYVRLTPPTPPGEQRIAIDLAPAMEALDSVEPAATQQTVAAVAPPQETPMMEATPEDVLEATPTETAEAEPTQTVEALEPPDDTKVVESTALAAVAAPSAITAVAPPEPPRVARKMARPVPKPPAERTPRPKREEARRAPPAAAANSPARAGAAAASRQNLGGAGASGDPDALRRWTSQIAAVLRNRLRYPDVARSAGVTGVTTVRFVVASNGNVIASSVVRSAGDPVLDRAALAAAAPGASLPAAPPQVVLQRLVISVPLQFSLR